MSSGRDSVLRMQTVQLWRRYAPQSHTVLIFQSTWYPHHELHGQVQHQKCMLSDHRWLTGNKWMLLSKAQIQHPMERWDVRSGRHFDAPTSAKDQKQNSHHLAYGSPAVCNRTIDRSKGCGCWSTDLQRRLRHCMWHATIWCVWLFFYALTWWRSVTHWLCVWCHRSECVGNDIFGRNWLWGSYHKKAGTLVQLYPLLSNVSVSITHQWS